MIKDVIKNLSLSSTLRINEISKEMESQGKEVFKFGFGQSPFKVPENVVAELKNNAHQNKYLPIQGLPELRETIAQFVSSRKKYQYKAENILVGPGTKELMFLLHILFDGEVILPAPSWVSYEPQAIIGRNKVHWVNTIRENNWFPTAEDIEKIVLKNKNNNYLLFLNSPNNPSGQIFENLKELSVVVKKYNILVLSDEIYSELSFKNNYMSISNYCPEQTIISSGLSKWCGAGGWRIGTLTFPKELENIKEMVRSVASETYTSVSTPIQYAAIKAYSEDHTQYLIDSRKILEIIANYVYKELTLVGIKCQKPQGGFYILCDFSDVLKQSNEISNGKSLCNKILSEVGFAMLPGSDFGMENELLISRIAFVDFDGGNALNLIKNNKNIPDDFLQIACPKIIKGIKKLKEWINNN